MTLRKIKDSLKVLKENLEPCDSKLIDKFLGRLDGWPNDESNLKNLIQDLDRILGNVWFSTDKVHSQVYKLIDNFRETIHSVDGMTMNEKLHVFGLMEVWDKSTIEKKKNIRKKLMVTNQPLQQDKQDH